MPEKGLISEAFLIVKIVGEKLNISLKLQMLSFLTMIFNINSPLNQVSFLRSLNYEVITKSILYSVSSFMKWGPVAHLCTFKCLCLL